MTAVSQTTLSSAFSWMKILEFRLKFHWCLSLMVQLTIFQLWFRWWLGAGQATSQYLNQWWSVYWRINVSLVLNELISLSKRAVVNYTRLCVGYTVSSLCYHFCVVWNWKLPTVNAPFDKVYHYRRTIFYYHLSFSNGWVSTRDGTGVKFSRIGMSYTGQY